MPADMKYCFRKNDTIIYKDADGNAALIDPYRRTLVKLNPAAHRIWQLLDGEHPVAAIIEMLKDEFDADAKILEKDVTGFIKELTRREMIK
jgi:coenzyme PQQ biosynthesis protein PqqD